MDTYNHFDYCESLTTSLKLFAPGITKGKKVFFKSPNSDSLVSISQKLSEINYPVLVAVNGLDSDFDDNNADALFEKSQYFIMVLQPALSDSPDDILLKQEECKQNILQIQSKLILESKRQVNGLTDLLISTFNIRSIGPIGDNLYGVIMGYNVNDSIDYSYDDSFWNS